MRNALAIAAFALAAIGALMLFRVWAPETARQVNYLMVTGERP